MGWIWGCGGLADREERRVTDPKTKPHTYLVLVAREIALHVEVLPDDAQQRHHGAPCGVGVGGLID